MEDIPELREFIQARLAQEVPECGYAAISHGSELYDSEQRSPVSYSLLEKEHWALGGQSHKKSDEKKYWA